MSLQRAPSVGFLQIRQPVVKRVDQKRYAIPLCLSMRISLSVCMHASIAYACACVQPLMCTCHAYACMYVGVCVWVCVCCVCVCNLLHFVGRVVFIKVALKTFDEIKQPAARSIRQHTSVPVSIHQHTLAYIRIRYVREHKSAHDEIKQSATRSIHQHPSASVSIRTSAHVSRPAASRVLTYAQQRMNHSRG